MSLGLILLIVLLLLLVGHRFQAEVKAMTNSDVRKLFSSAATPDIEETLVEMCLPFGAIHHWTVEIDDDGLHRCAVQLDEPGSNEAAARTLGGQLQGTTLHLDSCSLAKARPNKNKNKSQHHGCSPGLTRCRL